MPKTVQMVRFPSSAASVYLGPDGQLIVDQGSHAIRVQDGVTPGGFVTLMANNNLADLTNPALARNNLGVSASGTALQIVNNLSDLNNPATARVNLGLGNAAVENVSLSGHLLAAVSGSVTDDNIARFTGPNGTLIDSGIPTPDVMRYSANLQFLASASTSRTNLGLGSAAVATASDNLTRVAGVTLTPTIVDFHVATFTGTNGSIADSGILGTHIVLTTNNLSDLTSASTARGNLGLGNAAIAGVTNLGVLLVGIFGPGVVNNIPIFATTTGSIEDSGVPIGTAAGKTASSSGQSIVASVITAVASNMAVFNDNVGTINDSGIAAGNILQTTGNLAGISSPSTARSNLGFTTFVTAKIGSFTGGSTHSEAHGLTVTDDITLELWLQCVNSDAGYSPGDKIRCNYGGGSRNDGATVWINATNIGWSVATNGICIALKGGGGPAGPLNGANYLLYAVARQIN